MEEVDKIILISLADCGCDFAEDLVSLSQLSTENVVEAAVRCLRTINNDLKLSHTLPPGMSARFRIGTSLAQACQSVGYRGDIGYQTFLYSSEADVRKLFMFLVEKLPRKKDESSEQLSGQNSAIQQSIARTLKTQLSSLWLPSYCKRDGIRWLHDDFFIEGSKNQIEFHSEPLLIPQRVRHPKNPPSKELLEYYEKKVPFVDDQLSNPSCLVPSLIERNVLELSRQYEWGSAVNGGKDISPEEYRKREMDELESKIKSGVDVISFRNGKSDSAKLGGISLQSSLDKIIDTLTSSRVTESDVTVGIVAKDEEYSGSSRVRTDAEKVGTEDAGPEKSDDAEKESSENIDDPGQDVPDDVPQETEEERMARVEKEMKNQLRESVAKLEKMESDIHAFQETIVQAKEELRICELSNKTVQEKVKLQKKTLQLLPEAEENIAKLQGLVDASKQKLVNLEQQWEKHRIPLQEKYDELKKEFSQKETQSERKMKEVQLVRQRIRENTEEMKRKEQMEKQLTAQCAEVTVDVPRRSYTKRIFEIIANIRKQKKEIERVLVDVRTLQKELNQLEGRAERTFTAADDAFYKDAETNADVRQVYKYLVSLNVNCSQLLDTVEQTGEVMREIRNLEQQVADESKKNTSGNLEKITEDFKAMKKENADMMKKLKSLTAASPKPRKKK